MERQPTDFGKVVRLPEKVYPSPEVYPEKNAHPRLMFTRKFLETVRKNLSAEENQPAYRQYLAFSEEPATGVLEPLTTRDRHNMDYRVLAAIEAKAFRYALTGDAAYAREALAAIRNYIRTLDIPEGVLPDECRAYGYVIYIAACVYDWCYDTLTPQDREQLVAGCETFLAPHLEVEMPPRARAPSPATAPRPRFSGTGWPWASRPMTSTRTSTSSSADGSSTPTGRTTTTTWPPAPTGRAAPTAPTASSSWPTPSISWTG